MIQSQVTLSYPTNRQYSPDKTTIHPKKDNRALSETKRKSTLNSLMPLFHNNLQIQMSKVNLQNRIQGHRVEAPSNRGLEQKLSYQQLLNLNHDLSKENQQLKSITGRLGQQLRNLHTQFDIRPRQENSQLYNALGSHPILHQYELTLIPLFDSYEEKIQEFERGFETINEEFINLQKKYIQASTENERLRADLTDRTKELIEVYRSGSSEKLGADFGQLILTQINEKQKFLAEQNSRLQRQYQRSKSEAQKLGRQSAESKKKEQDLSAKLKQLQLVHRQLQAESRSLKERAFQQESRISELQSTNKQIQHNLQRAMSQVNQVIKDRDGILSHYEALKTRFEQYVSQSQDYNEQKSYNQERNPLEETNKLQQNGDDVFKKYSKLQKQYDNISREKNKLKQQIQQLTVSLDEANQRLEQYKKKIDVIDGQKRSAEMNEVKNKKLAQQFAQKGKQDLQKLKRQHEQEIKSIEDDYYAKIEANQKKNAELQDTLDKLKLERDKLQQENIINTTLSNEANKGSKGKDSERIVEKLREKLAINQQLFRQQLQIVQNDNIYLKREAQNFKNQSKERSQEIRKLKQEIQKLKRQLSEVQQKHALTIEQIKRVKAEYQVNLRDKQRQFQQKIKEIKMIIEETDRKRKSEREKVAESSREYKKVLEQIRNTYQERIRVLETEGITSKSKRQAY